jgi:TonB family protein
MAASTTPEPVVPAPAVAVSTSCESCGGPSEDGGLCSLCQSAFQALLEGALPKSQESSSGELAAANADADPMAISGPAAPSLAPAQFGYLSDTSSLFSVSDAVTPGAPPLPVVNAAPVFDDEAMKATEEEAARVEADEAARIEAARAESVRAEAARQEVEKAEAARAEAARIEAAKEREKEEAAKEEARAQAARSKVAETSPRPTPKSAAAPAGKQASAPARSGRASSLVGIAAAVIIVASIGLGVGAAWYKVQGLFPAQSAPAAAVSTPAATQAENVPTAPDPIAVAEAAIKASEAAAAAAERAAQAQAAAALKAKAAAPRVPPKNVRQPIAPAGQVVAAAPAPVAVIEPVRELVAPPPPPPVVVTPAAAIVSSEPARPYFEPKDVNEQPVVANRVEPRLPEDLRSREISEVLVVRLLVSQTGHPSSISLLRRSRTGQSLDDAVVAAIKQWTFSPAKKKGDAVSCWMNIGVPVGRAN